MVLLLLISALWIRLAERYNEALVSLAEYLLPGEFSLTVIGSHIVIEHSGMASQVSIEGLALHYGLILLAVLVLAAVGIGTAARLGWLLGMVAGVVVLHFAGVALLARGVVWASGAAAPESSGTMVFSLFAVFWGLLPAVIGVAWCLLYWLPHAPLQKKAYPPPAVTSGSTQVRP
jgi:hypothetical protein